MWAHSETTHNYYYTLSHNRLYLSTGTEDLHYLTCIIKPITVEPQLSGPHLSKILVNCTNGNDCSIRVVTVKVVKNTDILKTNLYAIFEVIYTQFQRYGLPLVPKGLDN